AVWNNALNTVADTMSAPQNAFLRLARLVGLIDNTVLLAVPTDFTKGVLEERLAAPLTDALSDQLGRDLHLAITVDASLAGPPELTADKPAESPASEATGASGASGVSGAPGATGSSEPADDVVDMTSVEADIFRVGPS